MSEARGIPQSRGTREGGAIDAEREDLDSRATAGQRAGRGLEVFEPPRAVKSDQVEAAHGTDDLVGPRQGLQLDSSRKGHVQEEPDRTDVTGLAEGPGDQEEVVVVHPDGRVGRDQVPGEARVRRVRRDIGLPVGVVVVRAVYQAVHQRPQRALQNPE